MAEVGKLRYHPNYRIGSERYNEYLKDLFTGRYYDRMVPYEDDPEKEAAYGERLWRSETEPTPYELLCTAVIGRAVVDLMEIYCSGGRFARPWRNVGDSSPSSASRNGLGQSPCSPRSLRMDQRAGDIVRFLEMYDEDGVVMNTLGYMLNRTRDPEWVLDVVKRNYSRFMAGIGKNDRGKKHETGKHV